MSKSFADLQRDGTTKQTPESSSKEGHKIQGERKWKYSCNGELFVHDINNGLWTTDKSLEDSVISFNAEELNIWRLCPEGPNKAG